VREFGLNMRVQKTFSFRIMSSLVAMIVIECMVGLLIGKVLFLMERT
jgi:hypothetical protein